jgi:phosphomannomutase
MLDHLHRRGGRGRVVKTFTVSRVIERLAASRGLRVTETPVGFKHIVDAMLGPGEPVLIGGEESGGIGLSAHLPERDGLANALVLLEAAVASGEGLAEAFARLERETGWRHAYDRLDLHLGGEEAMAAVRERLADPPTAIAGWRVESAEDLDGLKLNLERGGEVAAWVLFRASGTEPLLRVYCEAPTPADVAAVLAAARELVAS